MARTIWPITRRRPQSPNYQELLGWDAMMDLNIWVCSAVCTDHVFPCVPSPTSSWEFFTILDYGVICRLMPSPSLVNNPIRLESGERFCTYSSTGSRGSLVRFDSLHGLIVSSGKNSPVGPSLFHMQ